jgi:hypothetical protein
MVAGKEVQGNEVRDDEVPDVGEPSVLPICYLERQGALSRKLRKLNHAEPKQRPPRCRTEKLVTIAAARLAH